MKDKILILVLALLLGIGTYFLASNETFFKSSYKVDDIEIPIPKYSYIESECCMFGINFKSIRGVKSIQKDIDDYLNKLETNDNKACYYDKDNNITITDYEVYDRFPFNEIYLVYDKGYTLDEC